MEILNRVPQPRTDERPAVYSDRVGRWYAATRTEQDKKQLGQFLTPVEVAVFMAQLSGQSAGDPLRVLDPGAGAGVLSCAICEAVAQGAVRPKEIYLEAYELDPVLAAYLESCLLYAKEWLRARSIALNFNVRISDFVLTHAEALDSTPRLFSMRRPSPAVFDLVISNPPYFKIPKSDPRAAAAAAVVFGQPNIYALFMAVSAALLRPGGELIFITPRSYAAGPYFHLFRQRFFAMMRPEAIHVFGSRKDAFSRDEVLQENIILAARRADGWLAEARADKVRISQSAGIRDLTGSSRRKVAMVEVLDAAAGDRVLRIPTADQDEGSSRIVRSWSGNLRAYGLEISTGPVVAFRATSLISHMGNVPTTHAPLLWMQNVSAMQVTWPTRVRGKEQYIVVTGASAPLLLATKNYVLLRRFSAKEQKRRLTAAPFMATSMCSPVVGLENHLNYIYRPGGALTEEEAHGLAALLNSALLDTHFRTTNGNTQVSATELRAMPLPPLELIIELGRRAMARPNPEEIDALLRDVLNDGNLASAHQRVAHG